MITIQGLVGISIGIIGLIVMFYVIPTVGSLIDQSVNLPSAGEGSSWNSSVNTDVPTAVSMWIALSGLLKVASFITTMGGIFLAISGTNITLYFK